MNQIYSPSSVDQTPGERRLTDTHELSDNDDTGDEFMTMLAMRSMRFINNSPNCEEKEGTPLFAA